MRNATPADVRVTRGVDAHVGQTPGPLPTLHGLGGYGLRLSDTFARCESLSSSAVFLTVKRHTHTRRALELYIYLSVSHPP